MLENPGFTPYLVLRVKQNCLEKWFYFQAELKVVFIVLITMLHNRIWALKPVYKTEFMH